MAVGVGDGTTITFASSGFTGNIVSINGPSTSRAAVDKSHLGSSGWKEFQASGLVDGGEVSLTVQYDPTVSIPVSAAAETVTIDPAGSGQTLVFTAFVSSANHTFDLDEMMTADMTLKVSGAITGI